MWAFKQKSQVNVTITEQLHTSSLSELSKQIQFDVRDFICGEASSTWKRKYDQAMVQITNAKSVLFRREINQELIDELKNTDL